MGAGWYITEYRPLHQTVVEVNDVSFDMRYYVNMLKLYGGGQSIENLYSVTESVVRVIEQNELVRQGAEGLGISVSDHEVDEELQRRELPLSRELRDAVRAEMLTTKLKDEHFEHEVPFSDAQCHILAIFLESERQATEVRARLEGGEDFAELADELSLDSISKTKKGDLGWRPKGILTELLNTSIVDEYAFDAEVGVLSQPVYDEAKSKSVGYWLLKVLEWEEESALVQGILLGSEDEAQRVRARLEAGEDFATLAKELSQHEGSKENGGDLGLLTPGIVPAFDEFVFDSEVELGTISEIIRHDTMETTGGYWLIKVLDKDDNRQIEDDDRSLLKAKALEEWVSSLWDDPENKVESYLDTEKQTYAIGKVLEEMGR